MSHVRKQIRDQFVTLLTAGVTLVSSRVFATRVYPLTQAKLPAITVTAGAETSGLMTMGATMGVKSLDRTVEITVSIYENATASLDSAVDAIAVQVEEAIGADFTLGGIAKESVLTSTSIDFSGETEQPVGIATMTFAVRYVTSLTDVETAK
jgi:phosphoenolpyruvate-protein kinase (PTS system EI component)